MWRGYFGLIRKEFIQVRRDPNMLRIIFMAPIIQLLILGYAVNTDVKQLDTDIYDFDRSAHSREFVRSFEAGDHFTPTEILTQPETPPVWDLAERFKTNETQLALLIPPDFSERLTQGENVTVGLIADGSDANASGTTPVDTGAKKLVADSGPRRRNRAIQLCELLNLHYSDAMLRLELGKDRRCRLPESASLTARVAESRLPQSLLQDMELIEASRREIDSNINIGLAMAVLFEGLIDHAERDKASGAVRP